MEKDIDSNPIDLENIDISSNEGNTKLNHVMIKNFLYKYANFSKTKYISIQTEFDKIDAAKLLFEKADFSLLDTLEIESVANDELLEALFFSSNKNKFPMLKSLNLKYNSITSRGLEVIKEASLVKKLANLENLYLDYNEIGNIGLNEILQSNMPKLKVLSLKYTGIDTDGVNDFILNKFNKDKNFPSLKKLLIDKNNNIDSKRYDDLKIKYKNIEFK
jgi:hypothetical protein